jgi:hypothetical protein
MSGVLLLQVLVYSFTLWFGLYLLARDWHKPGLRFAGLGLVTYALGLAVTALVDTSPAWRMIPILLPSVFWMAATWHLLPDRKPAISGNIVGIVAAVLALIGAALNPAIAQIVVMIVPVLFLLIAALKIRQAFRTALPRQPLVTLGTATLFFFLGTALLILPIEWLSNEIVLLAISFDLVLLGVAVGYLDAYEEGTKLLPDALRSLAAAGLSAGLFGGQVVLFMAVSDIFSTPHILLLFTVIATAVTLETFSRTLQNALDKLIFADRPQMQAERRLLRSVNAALPRTEDRMDVRHMDEAEFARLTRRAISHFNDLDKLAASPLTHLPIITQRLRQQGISDNHLERAHLLKALLVESILRLKPYSDKDFDSSDDWRYYNSLYFPYVVGLKPYSVRFDTDMLGESSRMALDWFQTQVPERTLHNWQTTAAKLVAQHLRELQEGVLEK